MTKSMRSCLGLLCLAFGGAAVAAAPQITGSGGSGSPGGQAVVEVVVDFGASFDMASQDIKFQYDLAVLDFAAASSSVQVGGTLHTWASFVDQLRASGGLVMENTNDASVEAGQEGYALSYAGEIARSAQMRLQLAFGILPGAAPGPTQVTFKGSAVANALEEEFAFPDALQAPGLTVQVTAVPEPSQVALLLAGIGLLAARRLRAKA
ncbi:PEP-CTERM sorting domain-containing protein [Luteitalea sp.]|uniref:PEP-CTERM sorting domain-containing protein n=1 Tax=Luteitalea sp. TaxID=2004800 RepID=UPI0025BD2E22|nr:PEP-CTERM sorting domain-containing protein [Luteitalea sp.]